MPPRGSPRVGFAPTSTMHAGASASASASSDPSAADSLGPSRLTLRASRSAPGPPKPPTGSGGLSNVGDVGGEGAGLPIAGGRSGALAGAPSSDPFPPSAASSPLTPASAAPSPTADPKGKGKAVERRVLPARIRRAAGGAEGIRELEEMVVDWLERYGEHSNVGDADGQPIALPALPRHCRLRCRRSRAL